MSSTVHSWGRLTVLEMAPERKGLGGGHHLEVAEVVDGAGALGGLKEAVEDGEVLGLDVRAPSMVPWRRCRRRWLDVGVGVAELEERAGTVLLTILIMPPPTSFLYLTRRGQLDPCVAVHHEADGAGGREDGDCELR